MGKWSKWFTDRSGHVDSQQADVCAVELMSITGDISYEYLLKVASKFVGDHSFGESIQRDNIHFLDPKHSKAIVTQDEGVFITVKDFSEGKDVTQWLSAVLPGKLKFQIVNIDVAQSEADATRETAQDALEYL